MGLPIRPLHTIFQAPPGGIKLWAKNAAPTAMVITGCIGIGVGVVMACNATLKCDDILNEVQADLDHVDHMKEILDEERYSAEDYDHDKAIVYVKGGAKLVKLYLPATIVILGSIAMILGGHNILRHRHLALAGAYELLNQGYNEYRERVREDLGEDADRKYAYGLKEEVVGEIEEIDDKGKKHKKKVKAQIPSTNLASPYAFFWGPGYDDNVSDGNPYYDQTFLTAKQREWNRTLANRARVNGFVTLAEIKMDLGAMVFDGTEPQIARKIGNREINTGGIRPGDHMVGWIYDPYYAPEDHGMRDQIDFGIFNPRNGDTINGSEAVWILDPNVQGVLSDIAPNRRRK